MLPKTSSAENVPPKTFSLRNIQHTNVTACEAILFIRNFWAPAKIWAERLSNWRCSTGNVQNFN